MRVFYEEPVSNSDGPLIIFSMNARFLDAARSGDYGFGVVDFVLNGASAFASKRRLGGILAYRRDDDIKKPFSRNWPGGDFPTRELIFSFKNRPEDVQSALIHAIDVLTRASTHRHTEDVALFHQSNTLLPYTPPSLPFLVTHHGPFAEEIVRIFGKHFAARAFQGGQGKLEHLLAAQAAGLEHLKTAPLGAAIEISKVQDSILRNYGIPSTKIFRTPPPLPDFELQENTPSQNTDQGFYFNEPFHIITAAARVDEFKNLPFFVQEMNAAFQQGNVDRITLAVGRDDEHNAREALFQGFLPGLRPLVQLSARLPHTDLLSLLKAEAGKAVFVFTSRYETFGLTPFEAMLCGMATLIPDLEEHLGIAEFVAPPQRFVLEPAGLAARIAALRSEDIAALGKHQHSFARRFSGREAFVRAVDEALAAVRGHRPTPTQGTSNRERRERSATV